MSELVKQCCGAYGQRAAKSTFRCPTSNGCQRFPDRKHGWLSIEALCVCPDRSAKRQPEQPKGNVSISIDRCGCSEERVSKQRAALSRNPNPITKLHREASLHRRQPRRLPGPPQEGVLVSVHRPCCACSRDVVVNLCQSGNIINKSEIIAHNCSS